MNSLGIDAGATATKWALINDSGVIAQGVAAAMDGHLYRPASKSRMQSVLGGILKEIGDAKVSSVYMGITGVTHDGSIENEINSVFNCSSTVVSDIELAFRANFSDGDGILLYAGTGSVAFAIDENLKRHQIGGWGYLLGDEGAGYWIGKESIRSALFVIENKQSVKPGSLVDQILSQINAKDWEGVKAFVYSQDRSAIAALSKIVNSCVEQGDQDAILILEKAAGHLAELVNRIDKQLLRKTLPVIFTGGISSSKYLYKELEKFLRMRVSISSIDIALRAAELAR
jgi:N-acetylglucosamine kinase-like BadF-type ATPase